MGIAVGLASPSWARIGTDYQLQLGNPSGAAADSGNHTHYLIQRPQYAMDYNDTTRQANWVSWSFTSGDFKAGGRTDAYAADLSLPAGFTRIGSASFGSGYDRGHMCPSADRSSSATDNVATFLMSNMIPQASANNQGVWNNFEMYCRTLASAGDEVLIICGPGDFGTTTIGNGMKIPGTVWKIALVAPSGTGSLDSRTSVSTRVLAIRTPNTSAAGSSWQSYLTSPAQIEAGTGLVFFATLSTSKARYLRKVTDTGTGPNTPTAIASFSPDAGPAGSAVAITGYNFGPAPVVQFNGTVALASVQGSGTQISAVVPVGATTGTITVTSSGNGSDTSATPFTVIASDLAGWAAGQGLSGTAAEPTADPDHDGYTNATEYAFGTSPVLATGTLVNNLSSAGQAKITYLQRGGVTYTVRSATDLSAGFTGTVPSIPSSPQPPGLPDGYSQYEAAFAPAGGRGFLRVEALVP